MSPLTDDSKLEAPEYIYLHSNIADADVQLVIEFLLVVREPND